MTSSEAKTVMLLEDDRSLGATLAERLKKEGFLVEWMQTIAAAEAKLLPDTETADAPTFDLCILDVGLPDGNGFELAARVRARLDVPIIFLTAQTSAEDRLRGYEIGAEEYVPKPFHLRELFLRIEHVLANHARSQTVQIGDATVDFAAMSVARPGAAQEKLNQKEARVLRILIDRAPQVVSRDDLLDRAWGEGEYPSNRTVDNVIMRLRQILGPEAGAAIVSVRGVGYQFVRHA